MSSKYNALALICALLVASALHVQADPLQGSLTGLGNNMHDVNGMTIPGARPGGFTINKGQYAGNTGASSGNGNSAGLATLGGHHPHDQKLNGVCTTFDGLTSQIKILPLTMQPELMRQSIGVLQDQIKIVQMKLSPNQKPGTINSAGLGFTGRLGGAHYHHEMFDGICNQLGAHVDEIRKLPDAEQPKLLKKSIGLLREHVQIAESKLYANQRGRFRDNRIFNGLNSVGDGNFHQGSFTINKQYFRK